MSEQSPFLKDQATGEILTLDEAIFSAKRHRPRWCAGPDVCLSHRQLVSEFSREAVRISPYDVPADLEKACWAVANATREFFYTGDKLTQTYGIRMVERQWLYETINRLVEEVPEIAAWNERSDGRDGPGFVTAFSAPNPDDDFVDLGALAGNWFRELIQMCEREEASNREIDARIERNKADGKTIEDVLAESGATILQPIGEAEDA